MTYVNLTPHDVVVYASLEDGREVVASTIPASGAVARLRERSVIPYPVDPEAPVEAWPVAEVDLGDAEGLPAPASGVVHIVSMPFAMGLVAAGVRRDDVVYPFLQVRDESGRIVGCRGFARIA